MRLPRFVHFFAQGKKRKTSFQSINLLVKDIISFRQIVFLPHKFRKKIRTGQARRKEPDLTIRRQVKSTQQPCQVRTRRYARNACWALGMHIWACGALCENHPLTWRHKRKQAAIRMQSGHNQTQADLVSSQVSRAPTHQLPSIHFYIKSTQRMEWPSELSTITQLSHVQYNVNIIPNGGSFHGKKRLPARPLVISS